mmetsp:Transcript_44209/g.120446  ORF Transcript_44209/g.120446 Transcript_44209/m.120446 type:complete len:95 (-) Transcript_44209:89-373(-)
MRANMGRREAEFHTGYDNLLTDYMAQVGVDITSDLSPPKELMVEVRVLEDVGEVMMESGSVNLAKGTQHSLKRADVEHLVRQGYLEELERHESC